MSRFLLLGLIVVVLAGCNSQEPARPAAPLQPVAKAPSPPPPPPPPPPPAASPSLPEKTPAATSPSLPEKRPPAPPPPSLPKPPEPPREKAAVGVGEKGRQYPAYLYPAATYWAIREQVVFTMQIPKTMQLFEATEGRKPRDHEEFMQRIIKEGMIKLPDLPEGDRYVYDPKRGELMVEHRGPNHE
jgi:hypothetical protein